MSNDLTKRTGTTKPERQESAATNPASRLKGDLMAAAVDRLLGKDESIAALDNKPPRVILALANLGRSPGWNHAKALQRQMFDASVGGGLQMKFAFFGPDNAAGVRRFRITTRWMLRDGGPHGSGRMQLWVLRLHPRCAGTGREGKRGPADARRVRLRMMRPAGSTSCVAKFSHERTLKS